MFGGSLRADPLGFAHYCPYCKSFRLPRVHHCRVCKKCHYLMDHHCMWINNCVGYQNMRLFYVSMFHSVLVSLGFILLSYDLVINAMSRDWKLIFVLSSSLMRDASGFFQSGPFFSEDRLLMLGFIISLATFLI